ncbi:MAG TPA: alpha/beta fold hydrolase [Candidatus Paceibacterota bacterium]|nr:alpha/beta fold hydrolase [Candidatus Paceibacterota bacterium]
MRAAYVVEIITPKKFVLNGLWFGPKKPKRAILWIHGLSSSAFSKLGIVEKIVDANTAVLTFNNRGSATVSRVFRGRKQVLSGGGAEIFTECLDDIDGAIRLARKMGAKDIFLAGHSTGCQKAIYWAHKRRGRGVRGIILLAPLSDYGGASALPGERKLLARATRAARARMRKRTPNSFLPDGAWVHPITAQRFLSLYTPDSVEQSIFPYFDETRPARMFASVRLPILAFFAAADEYADRPAPRVARWFMRLTGANRFDAVIIPKVGHSFSGAEAKVAQTIKQWILA